MKKNKILTFLIILLFIIGISTSIYFYLNGYNLEMIINLFGDNYLLVITFFLLVFIFRIFLFIPSTVIIIALGFFLDDFLLTFIISLIGVAIGLIETYFIGTLINVDLENSTKIKKMKPYVKKYKQNGFLVTLTGCFLPFLPTDIICYSAGFVRYNFKMFLLAGMLGEIFLILLYSFFGANLNEIISKLNIYGILIILIFILIYLLFVRKKK